MSTTNLLYLDNRLAQASYSMSLSEQRLIFILLSKTKPVNYLRKPTSKEIMELPNEVAMKLSAMEHLPKLIPVEDISARLDAETFHTISVAEYASFCGIRMDSARIELKEAAEKVFDRYITFPNTVKGKVDKFRWVSRVIFDPETDSVSLRWSLDILPFITDLREFFTKLKLGDLLELQSVYSWKLYTAFASRRGENSYQKDITFTLEELLFILDVPESCKEFKHFNNLILKKVLKELQSKLKMTDLAVEQIREGRKIAKLVFKGFRISVQDTKKVN